MVVSLESSHAAAYESFGLRDAVTCGNWRHEFGSRHNDDTSKRALADVADVAHAVAASG